MGKDCDFDGDDTGKCRAPSWPGWPIFSALRSAAQSEILQRAWQQGIQRALDRSAYVRAMFETGHDAANRAAFRAEPPVAPDLVGLALHGPKEDVDKATKGARLHP
ncbi:DUF2000 family protein [Ramlibacter sp.]|uniref:DUF2000 family protein n=1 Tax=Ramlibacter sp. TaxID=1917967 RepID=UPI0039C99343